jgi:hypothetical protein
MASNPKARMISASHQGICGPWNGYSTGIPTSSGVTSSGVILRVPSFLEFSGFGRQRWSSHSLCGQASPDYRRCSLTGQHRGIIPWLTTLKAAEQRASGAKTAKLQSFDSCSVLLDTTTLRQDGTDGCFLGNKRQWALIM